MVESLYGDLSAAFWTLAVAAAVGGGLCAVAAVEMLDAVTTRLGLGVW